MSHTVDTLTFSEYSDSPNSRTWAFSDHTTTVPRLMHHKRTVPSNPTVLTANQKNSIRFDYGTTDAAGFPMQQKVRIELMVTAPIGASSADLSKAVGDFSTVFAVVDLIELATTGQHPW